MEREHTREDEDARDVADHPEWSETDIRAGLMLRDFEPLLAENIARTISRRTSSGAGRPETTRKPKRTPIA